MLTAYLPKSPYDRSLNLQSYESPDHGELVLARARAGQLKKLRTGNATQFFGGTSLFQIHVSEDASVPVISGPIDSMSSPNPTTQFPEPLNDNLGAGGLNFPYSPHDETCQKLIAIFFK